MFGSEFHKEMMFHEKVVQSLSVKFLVAVQLRMRFGPTWVFVLELSDWILRNKS